MKTLVVSILLCIKYVNTVFNLRLRLAAKNATMKHAFLIVLLFFTKWVYSDYCFSNPVAEGAPFDFSKTIDAREITTNDFQLRVQAGVSGSSKIVVTCNIYRSRCHSDDTRYHGSVEYSDNSKFTFVLYIPYAKRVKDGGVWSWYDGQHNKLGECDVAVYSFGYDPQCYDADISIEKGYVSLECTVNHVYPDNMDCQFQHEYDSTTMGMNWTTDLPLYTEKKKEAMEPDDASSDYTFTCILKLPFGEFVGHGEYTFSFTASLALIALGGDKTVTKTSSLLTVRLTSPQAELSNCPMLNVDDQTQGFIKEGDTETCQCRIKKQGIPPGAVPVWRDANGKDVGDDVSNGVQSLSIKYKYNDRHPHYTCSGRSKVGLGTPIYYTPVFALRPVGIRLQLLDQSLGSDPPTIDKCGSPTTAFPVNCDVNIHSNGPRPPPTVDVVASDGSKTVAISTSRSGGYYKHRYAVYPQRGGDLTMTCVVSNAINPDLTKSRKATIIVREPPSTSPVMRVNDGQPIGNGSVVTVTDGDKVKVNCVVHGGYPKVTRVITTCGGVAKVDSGPEVTQIVDVKNKGNSTMLCTCVAEHVTNCYHRKSEFNLYLNFSYVGNSYNKKNQNGDDSSGISTPAAVGIGVAAGVVFGIIVIFVVVKVRRLRGHWERKRTMQQRQRQPPSKGEVNRGAAISTVFTEEFRKRPASAHYLTATAIQSPSTTNYEAGNGGKPAVVGIPSCPGYEGEEANDMDSGVYQDIDSVLETMSSNPMMYDNDDPEFYSKAANVQETDDPNDGYSTAIYVEGPGNLYYNVGRNDDDADGGYELPVNKTPSYRL